MHAEGKRFLVLSSWQDIETAGMTHFLKSK